MTRVARLSAKKSTNTCSSAERARGSLMVLPATAGSAAYRRTTRASSPVKRTRPGAAGRSERVRLSNR
eukprot:1309846-Prymnesium_polylepis.1